MDISNAVVERFRLKNVWSHDGSIFLSKDGNKYSVQCMQDLDKLCGYSSTVMSFLRSKTQNITLTWYVISHAYDV